MLCVEKLGSSYIQFYPTFSEIFTFLNRSNFQFIGNNSYIILLKFKNV
jgi:hypothetical protein